MPGNFGGGRFSILTKPEDCKKRLGIVENDLDQLANMMSRHFTKTGKKKKKQQKKKNYAPTIVEAENESCTASYFTEVNHRKSNSLRKAIVPSKLKPPKTNEKAIFSAER